MRLTELAIYRQKALNALSNFSTRPVPLDGPGFYSALLISKQVRNCLATSGVAIGRQPRIPMRCALCSAAATLVLAATRSMDWSDGWKNTTIRENGNGTAV